MGDGLGGSKAQPRSALPLKQIYMDGNPNMHVIKQENHFPREAGVSTCHHEK